MRMLFPMQLADKHKSKMLFLGDKEAVVKEWLSFVQKVGGALPRPENSNPNHPSCRSRSCQRSCAR